MHCSNSIELTNDNRTACLKPDAEKDSFVKTVMGTCPLERREKLDPSASKYYVLLNIDNIDSTCICIGIQQLGGDLEKDSFKFRYGFQLNCSNGDVFRLS